MAGRCVEDVGDTSRVGVKWGGGKKWVAGGRSNSCGS